MVAEYLDPVRTGVDHVADCALEGEFGNIVISLRVFDIMAVCSSATPREKT